MRQSLVIAGITLLFSLVAFSGCKGSSSRQDARYREFLSGYGFRLEYPEDWEVDFGADRAIFSAPGITGVSDRFWLEVVDPSDVSGVEQIASRYRADAEGRPDQEIPAIRETELGGQPAYEILFTTDSLAAFSGQQGQVWAVGTLINNGQTAVFLTLGAPVDEYVRDRSVFEHIVGSFQATAPDINAGYRLQSFDRYGFVFEYPISWFKEMVSADEVFFAMSPQNAMPKVGVTFDDQSPYETLDDAVAELATGPGGSSGYEVIDADWTSLAGQRAYEVDFRYEDADEHVIGTQVVIMTTPGVLTSLSLSAQSEEEYEQLLPGFQHIIQTARFFGPTE